MDWSIGANREWLREQAQGHEKALADEYGLRFRFVTEFVGVVGWGQYTHKRFIDWVAEIYPSELYGALLELTQDASIPVELERRSRAMLREGR